MKRFLVRLGRDQVAKLFLLLPLGNQMGEDLFLFLFLLAGGPATVASDGQQSTYTFELGGTSTWSQHF